MLSRGAFRTVLLYEEEKGDSKIVIKVYIGGNFEIAKNIKNELFHHGELMRKGVLCIPKCFGDGYFRENTKTYIKSEYAEYSIE